MDYENFKKEYDGFLDWSEYIRINEFDEDGAFMSAPLGGAEKDDRVNQPSHYTAGSQEAIDIIEEAIKSAPNVEAGFLQGQVLKYLLRMWLKDNPSEDARKARWYLNRLIGKV